MSNLVRRISNSQSKSKHRRQRKTYMQLYALFLSLLVRLERSPSSNPFRLLGGLVGSELHCLTWTTSVGFRVFQTMGQLWGWFLYVSCFSLGSSVFGFQKMSTIPSFTSRAVFHIMSSNRVKRHLFWPKIIGVIAFQPACDFPFFQTLVGHGSVHRQRVEGSRCVGRNIGTQDPGMRWELGASTRFLLHGSSTFSSEKKCTIKLLCDHPCSGSWCWIRRNWHSWEKKDKWKVQLATPHQSPVPCKNTTRSMVAMQKSLCRRLATSCVSCIKKLRRLTVTNGRSKPLPGTRSNLSDHTALACLWQMDLPITYVLHPVRGDHTFPLFS